VEKTDEGAGDLNYSDYGEFDRNKEFVCQHQWQRDPQGY
jgi:hypothetical protein